MGALSWAPLSHGIWHLTLSKHNPLLQTPILRNIYYCSGLRETLPPDFDLCQNKRQLCLTASRFLWGARAKDGNFHCYRVSGWPQGQKHLGKRRDKLTDLSNTPSQIEWMQSLLLSMEPFPHRLIAYFLLLFVLQFVALHFHREQDGICNSCILWRKKMLY